MMIDIEEVSKKRADWNFYRHVSRMPKLHILIL